MVLGESSGFEQGSPGKGVPPTAHPEPVEGIILGVKQVGFYVYILNCADGSYYTGHTDNLEARMVAHETGQIPGYTQTRRPLRLVFAEELSTRQEAFERERQIKGWTRSKKRALIHGDWQHLIRLGKSRGSTSLS